MSLTQLEADINSLVAESLTTHKCSVRDRKVIHDPILGTNSFSKVEVAVMDLPLVQRLRYVSQTDVASLVYPSCHHARFDHSLGVAVIAGRLADAITQSDDSKSLITEKERLEIRLAALLHDVGHGPFSHLSEEIYQRNPDFLETKRKHDHLFDNAKPHEVLSYLMVTCAAFREYFDQEVMPLVPTSGVDLDRIARMIIGQMQEPDNDGYMGDIINGVFDADKLDYIQRDAYFSGLKMAVDVDRILHSIWVPAKAKDTPRRLTVRSGAVSALEQIMFDKVQLYSTIYHHHKVRAAECLMQALFETMLADDQATVNGHTIAKTVDWLTMVDADILFGQTDCARLSSQICNLKNRCLFKRALVICADTLESPGDVGLMLLNSLGGDPEGLRALRQLIAHECSQDVMDVWVDIPQPPSLREPSQFYVRDPEGPARKLEDYFPSQDWLATYSQNKARIHVFCPPDSRIRTKAAKCTAELLADLYKITLKPQAFEWAKNADE